MANRFVEELIKKSKAASIKNRGAYPMTAATNVYRQDGTNMESIPSQNIPEPDVIVNPKEVSIIDTLNEVDDGVIVAVTAGEIPDAVVLDKGITLQGTNAGTAQNYKQDL